MRRERSGGIRSRGLGGCEIELKRQGYSACLFVLINYLPCSFLVEGDDYGHSPPQSGIEVFEFDLDGVGDIAACLHKQVANGINGAGEGEVIARLTRARLLPNRI